MQRAPFKVGCCHTTCAVLTQDAPQPRAGRDRSFTVECSRRSLLLPALASLASPCARVARSRRSFGPALATYAALFRLSSQFHLSSSSHSSRRSAAHVAPQLRARSLCRSPARSAALTAFACARRRTRQREYDARQKNGRDSMAAADARHGRGRSPSWPRLKDLATVASSRRGGDDGRDTFFLAVREGDLAS